MIHNEYTMHPEHIKEQLLAIQAVGEMIRNSPDPKQAALKFLRDAGIIKR